MLSNWFKTGSGIRQDCCCRKPAWNRNRSANPTPAEVAEERRLFYVALTRCKEILVLSSFSLMPRKEAYQMRMQGALLPGTGEEGGVIASEFLGQLGAEAPRPIGGEVFLRNQGVR
jgi:superfamily I DNA/RNA helicase